VCLLLNGHRGLGSGTVNLGFHACYGVWDAGLRWVGHGTGGYLEQTDYALVPCHNLQSVTSLENVLAMYDEAWHYGRF
jgi:hypothetical protein